MIDLFIYLLLGSDNWTKMYAYIKYINIMENSYFMWLYVDLFMIAIKLLWHYYKHCYNYHKINITKPSQINTLYYCSVLSLCPVFSFPFSDHKKRINIYIHLILIIIIIIIIILGIFSCLCVVCVVGVCVPGGSRSLLKLSQPGRNWQAWKILASLANTGSGVGGGAVLGVILFREYRQDGGGNIWQSI